MNTPEMSCPQCHERVEPFWKACPACGQPLSSAARNLSQPFPPRADSATILESCYDQSWAVVIGINDYKKADPLQFAVPDAEAMPEALRGLGFARERVFSLLNAEATRQNIQDLLCVDVANKAGPNDRLFVFLAGHGQDFKTPTGQSIGYFIPVDGDPAKLASRCISMEEIDNWSKLIAAKHILYVMDCCYSGLAATRTTGLNPGRRDYVEEVTRRPVRQIITAGRADEKVIEHSGQGVFTRVLLRALSGDADVDGRGFITGFDLGHYLEPRVYEESGGRQKPMFRYLTGDGEFVFVLPRGVKAAPAKPSPIIAPEIRLEIPTKIKVSSPSQELGSKWRNSLGMEFVVVPGTKVLFSIWATREKDYEAFVKATGRQWEKPGFEQGPEHPAVNVSWEEGVAFCAWLTEKENKEGVLAKNRCYRLATDMEWSVAVGLPKEEGKTPAERSRKIKGVYPWGTEWLPPKGAGNYGASLKVDDYEYTSPVGRFASKRLGLFDMGGNVWEWCEDWYDTEKTSRVVRGGSWYNDDPDYLLSSCRSFNRPDVRSLNVGFRCVMGERLTP